MFQYAIGYNCVVKRCSRCHIEKSLSEFYFRRKGVRAGKYYEKCKECMKIRGRDYYHLNRERQLPLALKRKRKLYNLKRKYLNNVKNVPCADCKKKYPYYVMDFDHRKRSEKLDHIAHMLSHSMKYLIAEVEKCDIVCANCHRIRTYNKSNAEIAKVVTAGA